MGSFTIKKDCIFCENDLNLRKGCDYMKKTAIWLAVISIIIFVIAWGVIGLKILDGDYMFTTEAYVSLACLVICLISLFYIKIKDRCPHCGKMKSSFGKFCPYCGREIR